MREGVQQELEYTGCYAPAAAGGGTAAPLPSCHHARQECRALPERDSVAIPGMQRGSKQAMTPRDMRCPAPCTAACAPVGPSAKDLQPKAAAACHCRATKRRTGTRSRICPTSTTATSARSAMRPAAPRRALHVLQGLARLAASACNPFTSNALNRRHLTPAPPPPRSHGARAGSRRWRRMQNARRSSGGTGSPTG